MLFKPLKIKKTEVHLWVFLLFAIGLFFDFFEILLIAYAITAIHELSHILVAKMCNVKIDAVEILPFGITMRVARECISDTWDEIKIALAGPVSNFLIAYFTYGFFSGVYREYIITASLAMGAFNLIPALPMDGGRIMRALMVRKIGHIRGTTVSFKITGVLAFFIVIAGLLVLCISGFNFSFLIIGGFLIANLTEERKKAETIIMKDILFSRKKLSEKGIAKADVLVVENNERAKKILGMLSYDRYYLVNIADSRGKVVKTLTETEIIEKMAVYGMNITFKKIEDL